MQTIALLIVICWSGSANVHQVVTYYRNDSIVCSQTDYFAPERSLGIQIADEVNALPPRQAIYIVLTTAYDISESFWLYRQGIPVTYTQLPGTASPAQWQRMPSYHTRDERGSFWPPRLAPGEQAIDYVIGGGDASTFLALLKRSYPGGVTRVDSPAHCASFDFHRFEVVTTYTLTAGQLMPASSRP